jgi:hypothetical protein
VGRVGFYGCSNADRIVRVGRVEGASGKPPAHALVVCPACGAEHRTKLMWRPREAIDEGREPEILVGGELAESGDRRSPDRR